MGIPQALKYSMSFMVKLPNFPRSHRSSVGMHTDLVSTAKVRVPTEDRGNQRSRMGRSEAETHHGDPASP